MCTLYAILKPIALHFSQNLSICQIDEAFFRASFFPKIFSSNKAVVVTINSLYLCTYFCWVCSTFAHLLSKGQSISKKKCCPKFSKKTTERWGIKIHKNAPAFGFFGESRTAYFFWDFLTFSWSSRSKMRWNDMQYLLKTIVIKLPSEFIHI